MEPRKCLCLHPESGPQSLGLRTKGPQSLGLKTKGPQSLGLKTKGPQSLDLRTKGPQRFVVPLPRGAEKGPGAH